MSTIVTPLERGRAGKSFKKKSFFKKSILRCLNQYSNFPDMQIRFWLQDFIRKEQETMLVNKQLGYKNNSNLANNVQIDEGYKQKKIIALSHCFPCFHMKCLDVFLHTKQRPKNLICLIQILYMCPYTMQKTARFYLFKQKSSLFLADPVPVGQVSKPSKFSSKPEHWDFLAQFVYRLCTGSAKKSKLQLFFITFLLRQL